MHFNTTIERMKSISYLILSIFILSVFTSCSSVMVSHDYDLSTSFEQYKLFALEDKDPNRKTDPRYDNEILNNRFNNIIGKRLEEKGLKQLKNTASADLLVSFNYSIRPKMDLLNINKQVGFSFGSYSRYGGVGAKTCTDISEFDQGILFIDIRDAKSGRLVWRGTGTDIVSIYATPEKINTQVDEIVSAVLKKFPPN